MKKIVVLVCVAAATLASCDHLTGGKSLKAENDSLKTTLAQRNAELDDMMGTFNNISEGFRQINAAENRVDLQRNSAAEGSLTSKQQIASDIEFIRQQMQTNREQIAKLQAQLQSSKTNSAQLRRAIESLTQELTAKTQHIEALQSELAAKNIHIAELDNAVSTLSADRERLSAENAAKAQTVQQQDVALNRAWFVFGTKKELKEKKILTDGGLFKKGKVLESNEADRGYFTQIDIRTTKEIKLYAKNAELLTSHPATAYTLAKDNQGEYVLKISDADAFWSVSK
ncbi:MAG: hypothetical protein LBM06_01200, partial [Prevotellaceae bacterium]|nr:hypothetical protein [Prevotellaceae bacterium]